MKDLIVVMGGIVGSAIVFPASLVSVLGSFLGSAFGKSGGSFSVKIIMALSVLTMIGTLVTLSFTVINYIKPENTLKKILSIVIAVTGSAATLLALFMLVKDFSFILLIVLLAALAILASGLIQMNILKIEK